MPSRHPQLVAGIVHAEKVVRSLDEAFRRIQDCCLPLEDQRTPRV